MKRFFYALLLVSLAFLFSCAGSGRDIRLAEHSAALEVDTDANGHVDIPYGGTNAGTIAEARGNLNLGNVDNTSDADKPISTATQAALDGKQATMGADDNYVTDAEKVVIGNTSGTNTGDQDLSGLALKSNVLEKDNTAAYTPTADNHPATKKYVDDNANGSATVEDTAYSAIWNGDLDGTSKNTLHDYFSIFDTDHDGDFTDEGWFPSTSGAPTNASYLTTSAEAGLSAETVVSANAVSFLTAADYAAMRTLLDLETGIDVQAWSTHLDTLAADMAANAGKITGSNLDLSAPGDIGGTTPAAGTFTTLTADILNIPQKTTPSESEFMEGTDNGGTYSHTLKGADYSANHESPLPNYQIGFPNSSQVDAAGNLIGGGSSSYVATPPTYSDEACTAGQYALTEAYRFDCVASGNWNRTALTDWSNPTPGDNTPDGFGSVFQADTNVALSTLSICGETYTVTGVDAGTAISVTGGEYQIDSNSWTSTSGTVSNGNVIGVRQTSSASNSTTTDAVVTIGTVSDTYSVTTVAAGGDNCITGATILGEDTGDTVQGVDTRAITSKYTASCDGAVDAIIFRASNLTGDVKAAIYTDSGTEPDALVANSAIEVTGVTQTAAGDVTLTYSGTSPSLSKDATYWVVIQATAAYWEWYSDGVSGGDIIRYAKTYADAMPADWDAQGYTAYTYTDKFDLRIKLEAE